MLSPLIVGQTRRVYYRPFDEAGVRLAVQPPVMWRSSNSGVVAISAGGVLNAVGAGTARIYATAGGLEIYEDIVVGAVLTQVPLRIEFSPTTISLGSVGATQDVTLTVYDDELAGSPIPGAVVVLNVLTPGTISCDTLVGLTNASGQLVVTLTELAAGTAELEAVCGEVRDILANGSAPHHLSADTSSITIGAGGAGFIVTVNAQDVSNNNLPGTTIDAAIVAGTGTAPTVTPASDASPGVFTVTPGAATGTATLRLTIPSTSILLDIPVTINAAVGSVTWKEGNTGTLTAGGANLTRTAVVKDGSGNVLAGRLVTFNNPNTAHFTRAPASGTTDVNGEVAVVLTPVAAGGPDNLVATCETVASPNCAITVNTANALATYRDNVLAAGTGLSVLSRIARVGYNQNIVGGKETSWNDGLDNTAWLAQATGANQPTATATFETMDGAGTYLISAVLASLSLTTSKTIVLVGAVTETTFTKYLFILQNPTLTTFFGFAMEAANTLGVDVPAGGTLTTAFTPSATIRAFIIRWDAATGTITLQIKGKARVASAAGKTPGTDTSNIEAVLGGCISGGALSFPAAGQWKSVEVWEGLSDAGEDTAIFTEAANLGAVDLP